MIEIKLNSQSDFNVHTSSQPNIDVDVSEETSLDIETTLESNIVVKTQSEPKINVNIKNPQNNNNSLKLEVDETLNIENNVLGVNVTDAIEKGNKLPISSGAVYSGLENKADLVDGKIPASQLPDDIGTALENIDAENVKFSSDLTTTTTIGNITLTNGQATIKANGKSLKQVWDMIFVKEKNPSTTQPSVSLTFDQAKAYEVGTKITPSYSASLKAGSYTYGPATGVTATKWTVTDTRNNTKSASSGSFPELQVTDDTNYTITAVAEHTAGAVPVTNTGNEYAAGKISKGSKSKTSSAATGYRNSFYGTVENKNTVTSSVIRGLTKTGKALVNGDTFTVAVPEGALRVIIAYPATLRDVTSIQDENSAYFNIADSFVLQTINVNGANDYTAKSYKVYTLDFASANEKANNFIVTI